MPTVLALPLTGWAVVALALALLWGTLGRLAT
jgi:hypothetical protein